MYSTILTTITTQVIVKERFFICGVCAGNTNVVNALDPAGGRWLQIHITTEPNGGPTGDRPIKMYLLPVARNVDSPSTPIIPF